MHRCQNCTLAVDRFEAPERVCTPCQFLKNNKPLFDPQKMNPLLTERIAQTKGKFPYDALVGLSGGKDSTYVLYRLVNHYGLKVLAVTYDNGFLTPYAHESVARTLKAIPVDHEFYKPDRAVQKQFYKRAFAKQLDPCIGCSFSGYFLSMKFCHERNIPFFVHGRSPFQMFKVFDENATGPMAEFIRMNFRRYDHKSLVGTHEAVNRQIDHYLDLICGPDDKSMIRQEFFLAPEKTQSGFLPELLSFFIYEEYDEEHIKQTLEKEIGFVRPPNDGMLTHADCLIHDAVAWIKHQTMGINLNDPESAAMVRFGKISKSEAQVLSKRDSQLLTTQETMASVHHLCDYLGLTLDELKNLIRANKRDTVDFAG